MLAPFEFLGSIMVFTEAPFRSIVEKQISKYNKCDFWLF